MKSFKLMGLCLGLLLSAQGFAADFKLGYISIERVYREARPALEIQKKLDKEFSGRREDLKNLQIQGKKLEAQLVGKYDLILQDSVYVSPRYDLTEVLLKELDK
jgi:outer membrane protein